MVAYESVMFPVCRRCAESVEHLFVTCDIAMLVWYETIRWLGKCFILPRIVSFIFMLIRSLGGRVRVMGDLIMI